jgi:probable rRNA maturation factor
MHLINISFSSKNITSESKKNISKNLEILLSYLLGKKSVQIEVSFVTDKEIQEVNRTMRNKNKPTDVLSFPDLQISFPGRIKSIGEILISQDTLVFQAKEIGHSKKEELYRLLVHGLLHLLGYDHETNERDARKMRKKEDECLEKIFG